MLFCLIICHYLYFFMFLPPSTSFSKLLGETVIFFSEFPYHFLPSEHKIKLFYISMRRNNDDHGDDNSQHLLSTYCELSVILRTLHELVHLILRSTPEIYTIIPYSQMRRLRLRRLSNSPEATQFMTEPSLCLQMARRLIS